MVRTPKYCQIKDIADWLRVTVNPNSDPSKAMVEEYIMDNEDRIDRITQHTWLEDKQVREVFDVNKLYDWGRGQPLFPRKRNLKEFDTGLGDKFELFNGSDWDEQTIAPGSQAIVYFETTKGTTYIRGYLFTILTESRFRITYRYGGDNETSISETEIVPRDIKKCCKLMTVLDLLGADFQMSQVPYGGEGNVDKQKVMDRWQKEIDHIIWSHSELVSVW